MSVTQQIIYDQTQPNIYCSFHTYSFKIDWIRCVVSKIQTAHPIYLRISSRWDELFGWFRFYRQNSESGLFFKQPVFVDDDVVTVARLFS